MRTAGTLQDARAGAARAGARRAADRPAAAGRLRPRAAAGPEGRLPPGVIFITGNASVDSAVEALRLGRDGLPDQARRLRAREDGARERRAHARADAARSGALRGELRRLGPLRRRWSAARGRCRRSTTWSRRSRRPTRPCFVLGETGTGKELVAQTLHELSRRAKQAFVPINCGAVSPTLIESELFGHERGSFTGADRSHRGPLRARARGHAVPRRDHARCRSSCR